MSVGKERQGQCQPRGRWIRPEKRLAIYLRDGFACLYCGSDLRGSVASDVTLDHLLPRSAGGTNDPTNLITACRTCNCTRGNKPWVDTCSGGARDRIEQLRRAPLNMDLARALMADRAGYDSIEMER